MSEYEYYKYPNSEFEFLLRHDTAAPSANNLT